MTTGGHFIWMALLSRSERGGSDKFMKYLSQTEFELTPRHSRQVNQRPGPLGNGALMIGGLIKNISWQHVSIDHGHMCIWTDYQT